MTYKLSLGASPWGVTPAQLGTENYYERSHRELEAYMAQLARHYAAAHDGAALPCELKIAENRHDFGMYYDVAAVHSGEGGDCEAAYWLEAHLPDDWDQAAAAQLDLAPGDDLVWRQIVV